MASRCKPNDCRQFLRVPKSLKLRLHDRWPRLEVNFFAMTATESPRNKLFRLSTLLDGSLNKNRCERWSFWMPLMLGRSFLVSTRRSRGNEKSTLLEHFFYSEKGVEWCLHFCKRLKFLFAEFWDPMGTEGRVSWFFNVVMIWRVV